MIEERLGLASTNLALAAGSATSFATMFGSAATQAGPAALRDGMALIIIQPALPQPVADRLGAAIAPYARNAVRWGETNDPELLKELVAGAAPVVPAALDADAATLLGDGLAFLIQQVLVTAAVAGHLTQRKLQPLGLLHLEQLVLMPLEVSRGELLYSLPLAPKEKVTLAHKEWRLTEEEYSRFVQDRLENYSERGVAESEDMASASKSETEHSA